MSTEKQVKFAPEMEPDSAVERRWQMLEMQTTVVHLSLILNEGKEI